MRETERATVWLVVGVIGAIALGGVLVPLRGMVSASNLAFAFIIPTIVVAEMGGRAAGLATALVSAMSLNFFLTRPYLSLTIEHPDDIVAFFALAAIPLGGIFVAALLARLRGLATETEATLVLIGGIVFALCFALAFTIWSAPLVDVSGDAGRALAQA